MKFTRGQTASFLIVGVEHNPGSCSVFASDVLQDVQISVDFDPPDPYLAYTLFDRQSRVEVGATMRKIIEVRGSTFEECLRKLGQMFYDRGGHFTPQEGLPSGIPELDEIGDAPE